MTLLANLLNIFEGPQGIFILLIILLLFGAKKLPELARGMGKAIREFQKAKDEFGDELHGAAKKEDVATKTDVQPAQSTVARIEDLPAGGTVRPDPNQTVKPGDKADQV
jgi:sec-independent protein translocase protein TatA